MTLPDRVLIALEADDAEELETVVARRDPADLAAFREVAGDQSRPPELRQRAIYALGRSGDEAAIPIISEALPELPEGAVITAVEALGRIGTPAALAPVLQAADDPSPYVRKFAARALAQFSDASAVHRLAQLAREDDVEFVRQVSNRQRGPDKAT